jgi:hypothetical protein
MNKVRKSCHQRGQRGSKMTVPKMVLVIVFVQNKWNESITCSQKLLHSNGLEIINLLFFKQKSDVYLNRPCQIDSKCLLPSVPAVYAAGL